MRYYSNIRFTLFLLIAGFISGCKNSNTNIDPAFNESIEQLVTVFTNPSFDYSFDHMKKGVIQHLDRTYTYDYVPKEIEDGVLFQGIHRTPINTELEIELKVPAKVYLFFHVNYDGGLNQGLKQNPDWKRCDDAPKYDIFNGDHGKNMIMYVMDGKIGTYALGATTKDRACFNIVFKGIEDLIKTKK